MVKLTTTYLFRKIHKTSQIQSKRKGESDHGYLNRLTHLQLKSHFIDEIASMHECPSITMIYLQNNLLQNLQNIQLFPNLTHLHLEHNYISKMENLKELKALRKLYLGHNEISVVEGLEGLDYLTELHMEGQRLPLGETLYFDPFTVVYIAKSLIELNISSNNVTSLKSISPLFSLRKLIIEDNKISDVEDLMETLKNLPNLVTLNSQGNPVANDRKYLDHVVVASNSLKTLNGKNIDQRTRIFITNLNRNKECRKKASKSSAQTFGPSQKSFHDVGTIRKTSSFSPQISLGSKLFPLLKKLSDDRRRNNPLIINVAPPPLPDPKKVCRLLNSASNHY